MLESAIPLHLQTERTVPPKCPANYNPPNSAYCARFPESIKDLVVAFIGSQHQARGPASDDALKHLLSFTNSSASSHPPRFVDLAAVTDRKGYYNQCLIAYWADIPSYHEWTKLSGFKTWWDALDTTRESHGWYLEVLFPSTDRFETIFSDDQALEGAAHMREKSSGPILEHIYWGSMRDRLPASQTSTLTGEESTNGTSKAEAKDSLGSRIHVSGKQNLCIIRSGQDWSDTLPEERKLYEETMHPVLTTGMNYLRDQGSEIGCYDCRFMEVLDRKNFNTGTDKTFGLAYFDDISSLEKWSREHKTHLDIFGGFLGYVKRLNGDITLRLFHEVMVLKPEQQFLEYVGCHSETGMLRSLKG